MHLADFQLSKLTFFELLKEVVLKSSLNIRNLKVEKHVKKRRTSGGKEIKEKMGNKTTFRESSLIFSPCGSRGGR